MRRVKKKEKKEKDRMGPSRILTFDKYKKQL